MNWWKYRSKELLKAIFYHQKSNKKADRLCMKFSSISNTSVQRCLYPLFQNPPIFWCPLFSENYLNPQVRINKMVNKHTVDYHPSPSRLISRIHPLIFLLTPKGFISPESFLNFFLCILPHGCRNWICSFLLMPPNKSLLQVFIITPHAVGNYPFLSEDFLRPIFPQQ